MHNKQKKLTEAELDKALAQNLITPKTNIILQGGRRFDYVPADEYLARVIEIRPGSFNGKRDTLEFKFEIVDGPHRGAEIMGFANAHYKSFSRHTKVGRWYEIITGTEIEENIQLHMDDFFDKILKVSIGDTQSKLENQFSNVKDILELMHHL